MGGNTQCGGSFAAGVSAPNAPSYFSRSVLPPCTIPPGLSIVATGVHNTGNGNQTYYRCLGEGWITKVSFVVVTQSGAIQLSIYRSNGGNGPPTNQVATTGAMGCPPVGPVILPLNQSVYMDQNCYFGWSNDGSSAAVQGNALIANIANLSIFPGFGWIEANAYPPPLVANPSQVISSGIMAFVGQT